VAKSLKKCGISNSLDRTKDCLLWKDKSDSDESQKYFDHYGKELNDIAEELNKISLSDYE